MNLKKKLGDALAFRLSILDLKETNVFRLFDENEFPFLIEYYDRRLLIQYQNPFNTRIREELLDAITELFKPIAVYEASIQKKERAVTLIKGQLEESFIVLENNIKYIVSLKDYPKTGIYPDMRDNKELLTRYSEGKRILNAFSFTAAFSLNCISGGATETVNIDLAKSAHAWAKKNFALNGISPEAHKFISDDIFKVLPRLNRRKEKFGIIILDPPTFARSGKQFFNLREDYRMLLRLSVPLLEKGGLIACGCNTLSLSGIEFSRLLQEIPECKTDNLKIIFKGSQSKDFTGKKYLKFFLLKGNA